jgi:hypothetical protein
MAVIGTAFMRQKLSNTNMTNEQHKNIHIELHKKLDELVADYIAQTGGLPSRHTIFDLMKWSHEQTQLPTDNATTL